MKIYSYILIILLYSGSAFPAELDKKPVSLDLSHYHDKLVVEISNNSENFVKINRKFSIDPLSGVIHFVFKDDGKEKDLLAQINSEASQAENYLRLSPGSFYGSIFDLNHLKKIYGLNKKCYSVYIYYLDNDAENFDAFGEKIYSKSIKICK